MGTKKRSLPTLDDAGFMIYSLTVESDTAKREVYNYFSADMKKHYVKLAIEVWREVEKAI